MGEIDHRNVLAKMLDRRFARRGLLRGAGLGAAALAVPAFGPQPVRAAEPGHINLAFIEYIDTLDPHFTGFLGAIMVHNNIFNGLLKITYDGQKVSFVPDLAESWDMPDDKTHIFKIRPNVHFHDGTACDAEAIKWSLERVASGKPTSPHAWKLSKLQKIEIIDPLTVKLSFATPYAFLPVALTGSTGRAGTIVSRAAVEKYGKDFGRNPVGTGPFRFVSWRENDSIELERNPDYFEEGLPKLDRVTIKIMNEASSAVAALMAGQVDGMNESPLQFVKALRANPNLTVYGEPEGNYSFVAMNVRRAPFDDVELRRAVAFAIDREAIIKQAFFGIGEIAYSPISPPMTGFFNKDIAKTGRGQFFDPERAKKHRAAAKNQDVIEPVFIMSEQGPYGTRVAQTVLPMLEKIGIKPKLELMERAAWVARRNAGDFDMFDLNWVGDLDPDETLYPEFHSGEDWNYPGWSNATFDKSVEEAQVVLDVETRRKLYETAEDALMDEAPIAIISHMPAFKIISKRVQGFQYIPADLFNLHTVSVA
ncbi:peptide/nickel transport system substrate-binding protein [Arboricoccus pini]|uniref:Peptide/nickel transport system substrate-binding protein n=1 Tax=Arboricoccus pini TaxID=1963835 RepID=A0A212R8X8_9PROT|nr:ABC transporter substrate-binding protein [Arboricoccus pini]SNB68657.1 peptide/nickel transport system substrate-binding protein [Arboricoccus pini]